MAFGNIIVELQLKAKRFIDGVRAAEGTVKWLGERYEKTMKLIENKSMAFSSAVRQMLKATTALQIGIVALGTMTIAAFIRMSDAAIQFQQQLANVSTMIRADLDPTVKSLTATMNQYAQQIEELAVDVGEGTATLARGLYDVLSASFKAGEAMTVLRIAAESAKAGLTSTAIAAKAIIPILRSYSLAYTEAANVSDILFATVRRGIMTFGDLASGIGKVAATAASVKMPLAALTAGIATMTRAGLDVDTAITSMNQILITFLKPAAQSVEVAKKFGIELNAASISGGGLLEVINNLKKATPENVAEIFRNVRALRGMNALLQQAEGLTEDFSIMMNAAGERARAFEKQTSTLSFALERFHAAMNVLRIEVVTPLLPIMTAIVNVMADLFKMFLTIPRPIRHIATQFAALVVVGGTLVAGFLVLNKIVLLLASSFGLLSASMQAAITTALAPILPILGAIAVAIGAVIVAYQGTKAILSQVTYSIVENTEGIKETTTAWDALRQAIKGFGISAWEMMKKTGGAVTKFLGETIWEPITEGIAMWVEGFTGLMSKVGGFISKIPVVGKGFDWISGAVSQMAEDWKTGFEHFRKIGAEGEKVQAAIEAVAQKAADLKAAMAEIAGLFEAIGLKAPHEVKEAVEASVAAFTAMMLKAEDMTSEQRKRMGMTVEDLKRIWTEDLVPKIEKAFGEIPEEWKVIHDAMFVVSDEFRDKQLEAERQLQASLDAYRQKEQNFEKVKLQFAIDTGRKKQVEMVRFLRAQLDEYARMEREETALTLDEEIKRLAIMKEMEELKKAIRDKSLADTKAMLEALGGKSKEVEEKAAGYYEDFVSDMGRIGERLLGQTINNFAQILSFEQEKEQESLTLVQERMKDKKKALDKQLEEQKISQTRYYAEVEDLDRRYRNAVAARERGLSKTLKAIWADMLKAFSKMIAEMIALEIKKAMLKKTLEGGGGGLGGLLGGALGFLGPWGIAAAAGIAGVTYLASRGGGTRGETSMQRGGVARRPTRAIVGDTPEAIIPLNKITPGLIAALSQGIKAPMPEMPGAGGIGGGAMGMPGTPSGVTIGQVIFNDHFNLEGSMVDDPDTIDRFYRTVWLPAKQRHLDELDTSQ